MSKIRILHILNTGSYSGAENAVITVIKNTEKFADSIYLSKDGSIRDILEELAIEFYPVKRLDVVCLKHAIHSIKPDIIHAHDFTAGIICAFSVYKIPIINHLHSNAPWLGKISLKTIIYGISAIRYKKILSVSDSVMKEYVFGDCFVSKTVVIGNPFDKKIVIQKAKSLKMEREFDVIFLGRYTYSKNPTLFVDIIKSLSEKLPEVRAVMVGDGEMRSQLERYVKELGESKHILICGFQKNPYMFLDASRVLVMPSRWEGFGFSAVEALAIGKPVLASPVGGLKNIVNLSCGKLCDTKEEFVNELYKLLTDKTYYYQKSKGALVRIREFDNILEYMDLLEHIYKSI